MVMNVSHAMWCDQYFDWVYFSKLAMVMNVSHTMWHDQYFDWVYFSKLTISWIIIHAFGYPFFIGPQRPFCLKINAIFMQIK